MTFLQNTIELLLFVQKQLQKCNMNLIFNKRVNAIIKESLNLTKKVKKIVLTQPAGFEPARGDPNGFQVHRLNRSATTAFTLPLSLLSFKP